MSHLKLKKIIFFLFFIVFFGCSKIDPVSGEKVIIEPNPIKRAEEYRDKGGGLLGDIGKIGQNTGGGGTVSFASSNVMWRATLKSLEFLPLLNADYAGGIIIYDWYSESQNPQEQVKISIQFLSNELRSDSLKITAHKRICDNINRCINSKIDKKFNDDIKENIISTARSLKIEEAKKDKK
jgi:hypothetical protein